MDNIVDKRSCVIMMRAYEGALIKEVQTSSIAEEVGLEPGDKILKINGEPLRDIIDYQYYAADTKMELEVIKSNGENWIIEIEKDEEDNLGLIFYRETFDNMMQCCNKCIFCFVNNLPGKMRKSLYIKDDDYRHSFLHGNYITLTNLKKEHLKRIVSQKLSPLYVSVHATDGKLRAEIMGNKAAGRIMEQLRYLTDNGIEIHTQVVLLPGINDGIQLEKTIDDLLCLWPGVRSLAVVPVGLTAFSKRRDLRTFDPSECREIIEFAENKQKEIKKITGSNFFFLADEFYLKGRKDLPEEEYYEGYHQLENGVGMARLFLEEVREALREFKGPKRANLSDIVIVTGEIAYPVLEKALTIIKGKTGLQPRLEAVPNSFFGTMVTVTGLLTGFDLIKHLKGRIKKEETVVVPDVVLKEGENVLLDNTTPEQIAKEIDAKLTVISYTGKGLVEFFSGEGGKHYG